jgi:hypothetical protein
VKNRFFFRLFPSMSRSLFQRLSTLGIVAENSWTLIDPTGMRTVWLAIKEDRVELYPRPSTDVEPVVTIPLTSVEAVSPKMSTIVCIQTSDRLYYLQRAGVPVDGEEQQTILVHTIEDWIHFHQNRKLPLFVPLTSR